MEIISTYTEFITKAIETLNFPGSPTNLYDPIRYFMTIGGKRMRPMLTLLAGNMFDVQKNEVINAAIAVELFHNFSLIHDDIMDQAPFRRTHQTVHEKWNSNVAILSGDVLMIYAYQQLTKQQAKHLPDLIQLFNKTAIEVCEGQQMDMDFETIENVSIDQYIEMIRLKTSVLLGCALEMGAIIANQTEENRKHIYDFGINIGLAFQLQDDYLDLYGETAKFGKQIGGDILANKKTFLSITCKELANDEQYNQLQVIQKLTNPIEKINQTKIIFEALSIPLLTQKMILHYHEKGLESLQKIDVLEEKKKELMGIANFLLTREI